jgi:hypothetical protein
MGESESSDFRAVVEADGEAELIGELGEYVETEFGKRREMIWKV